MKCKRYLIVSFILFLLLAGFPSAAPVKAAPLISYGMLPVYPQDIEEGEYGVEAVSDSPYFNMEDAVLYVKDGEMKLRFTIPSLSYLYVYQGTAKEARHAEESAWIPREEADGESIFEIPAGALDKEIPCAAYSKAKKRWYPRNIVVYASSLPKEALKIDLPDYALIDAAVSRYEEEGASGSAGEVQSGAAADTGSGDGELRDGAPEDTGSGAGELHDGAAAGTGLETDEAQAGNDVEPETIDLPDGEYSIECNMTGGSGRASISSPTYATVKDGKAYARLIWSSTYYDYMLVGGEKYLNETKDGGPSTFTIPITVFDDGMKVIADTTAMGDPVEIEYVLTFYSDSFGDVGLVPQEAAKNVLIIGLIIIAAGGVLNYFVKRKRN